MNPIDLEVEDNGHRGLDHFRIVKQISREHFELVLRFGVEIGHA
jgi:hypothetical protein